MCLQGNVDYYMDVNRHMLWMCACYTDKAPALVSRPGASPLLIEVCLSMRCACEAVGFKTMLLTPKRHKPMKMAEFSGLGAGQWPADLAYSGDLPTSSLKGCAPDAIVCCAIASSATI
jgi:hypothetical protein